MQNWIRQAQDCLHESIVAVALMPALLAVAFSQSQAAIGSMPALSTVTQAAAYSRVNSYTSSSLLEGPCQAEAGMD